MGVGFAEALAVDPGPEVVVGELVAAESFAAIDVAVAFLLAHSLQLFVLGFRLGPQSGVVVDTFGFLFGDEHGIVGALQVGVNDLTTFVMSVRTLLDDE